MTHILVTEDEKDIREFIELHLRREGYQVTTAENGEEALSLLQSNQFDLVVLDWMLPQISGIEICRSMRSTELRSADRSYLPPVLMITARADTADIVVGLEAGADDYLVKPFEILVFLARVRALIRRQHSQKPQTKILEYGHLQINLDSYEVYCCNKPIQLTQSEYKLLVALLENRGRVLSRNKLISLVQGEDIAVTARTIDTHIFGLRKKLGDCANFVETLRGIGYRIKNQV